MPDPIRANRPRSSPQQLDTTWNLEGEFVRRRSSPPTGGFELLLLLLLLLLLFVVATFAVGRIEG